MDQTYETMYHTYDWPAFCLYQPKTPAGKFFSELIGPGKDQSVKVWSASSCELVWDPRETPRGRTGVGWIWDSMGTTTPAIFLGVTPRNGIVMDLLIEKYGLPGPRLGLVFVRFLSLSHGASDLREATALELAVAWMDRHRHSRCEVWWLWVCPQISPNSR